jgi:hypothetical protein
MGNQPVRGGILADHLDKYRIAIGDHLRISWLMGPRHSWSL